MTINIPDPDTADRYLTRAGREAGAALARALYGSADTVSTMATVLNDHCHDLTSKQTCIEFLLAKRFPAAMIDAYLDAATDRARVLRTGAVEAVR